MARMEELVSNITMFQLMVQGLLGSYESSVTTFYNIEVIPSFDKLCAKLLTEVHNVQQFSHQLGVEPDKKVLYVAYSSSNAYGRRIRTNYQRSKGQMRGESSTRGQGRGRGYSSRGRRRNQFYCYGCG